MTQADRIILQKMIDYCDDIIQMKEEFGNTPEAFKSQKSYRYAVSMCILQIGELVNRLSPEIMTSNVQVPWRLIRAMRNLFAHNYEKTEMGILWETARDDIPALKSQLIDMMKKEEKQDGGNADGRA